ncbi:MAG: AzlD domain-containing protein [Actinomycetota bacterium]|nr:AzlD domain-containing protein [Actinomycetota bacterium]MDQ5828732.1 AzlD domain-containing protein [Actinomycetota bacterium]
MRLDPQALLTIALMALATYATRSGGLWLASRLALSERMEAWLGYIPGAILVSLVAPTVLTGGLAETLAAVAVIVVALRTGSLPVAMVAGVGAVLVLRAVLPGMV